VEEVAAEGVADPLDAPDVGDGAGVGELPGFAGRGGAFAAGGGEAAGAGRAGGTVGIAADRSVGFGAVAGRMGATGVPGAVPAATPGEAEAIDPAADGVDVEEPATGEAVEYAPEAEGPVADEAAALGAAGADAEEPATDEATAVGVLEATGAEVAGDAPGRLASVGVAEVGRAESAARAVGMLAAPELAGRAGAAPGDAVPDAGADTVDAPSVVPDAEEPVGAAPVLAEGVVARGAAPACVGCEGVDFGAVDLLEVSGVDSVALEVAGLRAVAAPADEPDDGTGADPEAVLPEAAGTAEAVEAAEGPGEAADVAESVGAADNVGGIGASPDPKSAASNIGDAHVPE